MPEANPQSLGLGGTNISLLYLDFNLLLRIIFNAHPPTNMIGNLGYFFTNGSAC